MASTRHFGVLTDTSGISSGLIVTDMNVQNLTDTAEARDTKGEVIDIASYSLRKNISINGLWCGSGISAGTIVTVGGKSVLVTENTKSESNQDFQKGSMTAVTADNAELWDMAAISGQSSQDL